MNTSKEFCIGEFYQHENHLCYHFRASHSSLLVCTQHEIFVDHLLWVFQDHLQIACCHAKKSRPDASEFQCCKTDRTNNAAANAQARTHYRSLVAVKWKPGLEWKATQDCSDQFAVDSPSVVLLLICDFLVLGLKPLQAQPEVLESAGATGKVKAQQRRMTDLQNNRVHIANMLFLHMTIASSWHRTEAVSRPIWLSIFWRMLLEAAMVYSIGAWNLETHLGTWIPQRLDAETAPGTPESRPSSSLGFYEVSKMLENKQHGEETRQVQEKKRSISGSQSFGVQMQKHQWELETSNFCKLPWFTCKGASGNVCQRVTFAFVCRCRAENCHWTGSSARSANNSSWVCMSQKTGHWH